MLNTLLHEKKISKYRLSKDSGIPYSTINDICNGKAHLEKCSAETVYRISRILDISMEKLLESYIQQSSHIKLHKNDICYYSKENENIEFIAENF